MNDTPPPLPALHPERPSKLTALLRGLRCRCPRCGIGSYRDGYLTVTDHCHHCGEKLGHIRADDGPAYFTILVVGHIVVPGALTVEQHWAPPLVPFMAGALLVTCLLIWLLLPAIKGGMVGVMWALKLRGDEVHGDTPSQTGR
ncbi:MAG: DUF983 domain-containing protein [Rhodospirillaceae bacterium]|nr:DUF983 domain-containing protein [Rhodospirillales bacterium]